MTIAGAKRYFVCSYGGCASWTLRRFLQHYGTAYHIHSCRPPEFLTLPVSRKPVHRLFNYGVKEHFGSARKDRIRDTSNCSVIYLFVKPAYSIFSRKAFSQRHLRSIGVERKNLRKLRKLSREEYITSGEDLIDYESFFHNYVMRGINRNYDIIAVNVHKLWNDLESFFTLTDLPLSELEKFPQRQPHRFAEKVEKYLNFAYRALNEKIDAMAPVTLIEGRDKD